MFWYTRRYTGHAIYLLQRSHSFYFRIRIPLHLQPVFGKRELKKALDVNDRSKAQALALSLGLEAIGIFEKLSKKRLDNSFVLISLKSLKGTKVTIEDPDPAKEAEIAANFVREMDGTEDTKADSAIVLSTIIERYCAEKTRESTWSEKTANENLAIYQLVLRIIDDIDSTELSAQVARQYKDTLLKLPTNPNKSPEYRIAFCRLKATLSFSWISNSPARSERCIV